MARWRKVKPGTAVVLLEPTPEFDGIIPNPAPVGMEGVVIGNPEEGWLLVDWGTGYTAKVHRSVVRVKGR